MTKEQIKALIDAQIIANGVEAITGPILNNVLTNMLNFSRDEPFSFKNTSGSGIVKGDVCEIVSYDLVDEVLTVRKLGTSNLKSKLFVAFEDVATSNIGQFRLSGLLTGLSGLDSFTNGDKLYWNATTGLISNVLNNDYIFIGVLISNVISNGTIDVKLNETAIKGGGVNRFLAKWNGIDKLTTSSIEDDGTRIGINATISANNKITIANSDSPTTLRSDNTTTSTSDKYGINVNNSGAGTGNNFGARFRANGSTNENTGVLGIASTIGNTNTGGYFSASAGAVENIGIVSIANQVGLVNYLGRFEDGTQALNRVIYCLDNNGKARWTDLKTVNGNLIIGTGNINTKTPTQAGYVSTASINIVPSLEFYIITAQNSALSLTAPAGVFNNGDIYRFRIKDDGTPRAISYNSRYRAMNIALPLITVANKYLYLEFIYNSIDDTFDAIQVVQQL